VIQAKNALTNDKASLSQILQLDPSESFVLIKPNWNIDEIRVHDYDLVKLYQTGLNSRADYKRVQTLADASRQDYKGAFNGYLPSLTGFVTFGSTYFDANNPNRPTDPIGQQLSDRRSTSYGLNVTIPLWDRLQARNNRVFNRVTLENANNDVENLEIVVKLEIQNAYNNFVDVKSGYEVSLAQYDASKLAYETQQESYSVGLATQVDLAIANASYIGAQANLAQTGYRLLFQKIILDYATGVLTVAGIEN
jgi:outer membrane protein